MSHVFFFSSRRRRVVFVKYFCWMEKVKVNPATPAFGRLRRNKKLETCCFFMKPLPISWPNSKVWYCLDSISLETRDMISCYKGFLFNKLYEPGDLLITGLVTRFLWGIALYKARRVLEKKSHHAAYSCFFNLNESPCSHRSGRLAK